MQVKVPKQYGLIRIGEKEINPYKTDKRAGNFTCFSFLILNDKQIKMSEKLLKYDIILQNCSSREYKVYGNLQNISDDPLYLSFNIELDLPVGEYNYAVIVNMRNDVEYEFKAQLTDTILHTADGDVRLDKLSPILGLLKIEGDKQTPLYFENKIKYIYL